MFSAACDISKLPRQELDFDVVLVDTVNGFDTSKTFYTVNSSGFYFIHMSIGIPSFVKVNYALNNGSTTPNILLSHTKFDGEVVTSRDDVQYLNEGQRLYLSTDYSIYNDGMMQTTWSGIKLDDIMSTLIAFRVSRSTSYFLNASFIPMDSVFVNLGQAWDLCNNAFVAPKSGIYFLSWSTAAIPNTMHEVLLMINDEYFGRTMIRADEFNGTDTSSQSLLLSLSAGDVARLWLYKTGPIYSDFNYQTSFTGFLYEPRHGQNIAWTLSLPFAVNAYIYGPININFTNVLVDLGNSWDSRSTSVVIAISGIYFLKLSGTYSAYGLSTYQFNLILLLNGKALINVMEKIDSLRTQHCNIRSRSLIIRLQQGDKLITTVPAGYAAWHYDYDITFVGFLIQPDPNYEQQRQISKGKTFS